MNPDLLAEMIDGGLTAVVTFKLRFLQPDATALEDGLQVTDAVSGGLAYGSTR